MKLPTSCVEKIMSKIDRIAVKQLQSFIEAYGREIDCTWDGEWLRAVYAGYYGYDMKVNVPVEMIRKLHNKYSERLIDFRYTTLDAMSPHVFNTLNERNNQALVFIANENTKKCRLMDMDRVEYIINKLDRYVIEYALRDASVELTEEKGELKKAPRVVVPDGLLRPYEGKYKVVEVPIKDILPSLAKVIQPVDRSELISDCFSADAIASACADQLYAQEREFQHREWLRTLMRFSPTFIAEPYTYIDDPYPYSDDPFSF